MSTATTPQPVSLDSIAGVWRGSRTRPSRPVERTGFASLDDTLNGGWPQGSLTEIVSRYKGYGFSMVVPFLARLTQQKRHVALVNTPYLPYAPALDSRGIALERLLWIQPADEEQALWTVEQLLHSGHLAGIAFWTKAELDGNTERRLQLAAETSRCVVLNYRGGAAEAQSYATLKVAVAPAKDAQTSVEVLKCRGGRTGRRLIDPLSRPRAVTVHA